MNKKTIAILMGVILAFFGISFVAAAIASAHDAPPSGSANCQTTGPDAPWEVLNGSATTENTGGTRVVVTITSSAGTVAQTNGHVRGDGKTISFSVKNIPAGVSSIVVSSTTKWFDNGGGTDTRKVTISKPENGCLQEVPVPAKPTVLPADCFTNGLLEVPGNTDKVKWLVNGQQFAGGQHGSIGVPGTYTVSAHTTYGYVFENGEHSVSWTLTVDKQKDEGCHTDTSTPPASSTSSESSPPSTSTHSTPSTESSTPSESSSSRHSTAASSSSSSTTAAPKPSSSTTDLQVVHKNAATPVAVQKDLASTGVQSEGLIAVAILLLAGGTFLLFFSRRGGKREQ